MSAYWIIAFVAAGTTGALLNIALGWSVTGWRSACVVGLVSAMSGHIAAALLSN